MEFAKDPKTTLLSSLDALHSNPTYRENYQKHIFPMLFDDTNSNFDFCLGNFATIATNIIEGPKDDAPQMRL